MTLRSYLQFAVQFSAVCALALIDRRVHDQSDAIPRSLQSAVIVGAGDIASCTSNGDEATARLLDAIPGTVFTLGDNVYPDATAQNFASCYAPSWGRHKARTRPSPGNHGFHGGSADAYFDYFGAAAGPRGRGYYSYDVGAWHLLSLDSDLILAGDTTMLAWVRDDLRAHHANCSLAYFHHPRFSSGMHGSEPRLRGLWQVLYDGGIDVVLSGHDHIYERFAPQRPDGTLDRKRGIREFVVGTGGADHHKVNAPIANSEVQAEGTYGVLKLDLRPDSYDWRFIPIPGKKFTDSGTGRCNP